MNDPYTFADLPTIADHRHFVGDSPHGGNGRSDGAGGGHAHCGLLVYQGGAFPAEYRDSALFFNVHGNRMNRDLLVRWRDLRRVPWRGPAARQRRLVPRDLRADGSSWGGVLHRLVRPAGVPPQRRGALGSLQWPPLQAAVRRSRERGDRPPGDGRGGPGRLALGDDVWAGRRARRLLQERGSSEDSSRALDVRLAASANATQRLHAL